MTSLHSNKRVLSLLPVLGLSASVLAFNGQQSFGNDMHNGFSQNPFAAMAAYSQSDSHMRELEVLKGFLTDPTMNPYITDSADLTKAIAEGKKLGHSEELVRRKAAALIPKGDIISAMTHRMKGIVRESKGLEVSDVVARGIAGKNWRAVADMHSGSIAEALRNVAAYKGAEVLGNHLSDSIEHSVGDWLDTIFSGTLGLLTERVFNAWRSVRNGLTGRSGMPFTGRDLKLWRETTSRILLDLERLAKNASIMDARSRDKVLRDDENEEDAEPVDPTWAGQRNSFGMEFAFISNSIAKRREYYDPEHDEAIVFYSTQLTQLLHDLKDNVLHKVRSHRDLGASSVQSAVGVARNALDLYFHNLITLVAPRAAGERESTDANSAGMQPGMQGYGSTFGGYGGTF